MNKKELKLKIRKALEIEGGAAGMGALKDITKQSKKDIKKAIASDDKVGQHPDKDYILDKGKIQVTEEEIMEFIQEELAAVLDEKRKKKKKKKKKNADDRCTRIAKRKYKVWPSAYASGAVVRCRDGKIWKNEK